MAARVAAASSSDALEGIDVGAADDMRAARMAASFRDSGEASGSLGLLISSDIGGAVIDSTLVSLCGADV